MRHRTSPAYLQEKGMEDQRRMRAEKKAYIEKRVRELTAIQEPETVIANRLGIPTHEVRRIQAEQGVKESCA